MDRLDVSQDVLRKIRGLCRETGQTEDQVLRRLLESRLQGGRQGETGGDGFTDATYAIHFPAEFEIFRTYKGRLFSARVVEGRWMLDADGRSYDSLNQLSQGVIDGNENAWNFWFCRGPDGRSQRIAELRDPALVQKRPRRRRTMTHKGVDAFPPSAVSAPKALARHVPRPSPHPQPMTPTNAGEAAPGMPWEPRKS
ncbi:MAG: hypothetical protein HQ513_11255 [Rhodospirillales bacterium]|nr:hypothetical protein [Rhodospirillales bacterium]